MSAHDQMIEDLVYQAKLAEQAERYEEMVEKMKEVRHYHSRQITPSPQRRDSLWQGSHARGKGLGGRA